MSDTPTEMRARHTREYEAGRAILGHQYCEMADAAEKLERENAALRAELEAVRKDAERWHFVSGSMSHNHGPIQDGWTLNMLYPGDDPESAIDAAIAQGKGEK